MPLVDSDDLGNIDGKVHSHRFPGANTAVPLANRDQKQLQTTIDFLQDKQVGIDIFAMALGDPVEAVESSGRTGASLQLSSTFAVGEESESFGARGMVHHTTTQGGRSPGQDRSRGAARGFGAGGRGGEDPERRPFLPRRNRGRLRCVGGASGC